MGLIALTLAVLVSAVEAEPPTGEVSVPFELSGGRIYVQAMVNGRGPYRFAVDTGASGIGRADTRLATELALKPAGEAQNSDGAVVVTNDVVRVDSLTLGPVTKRNAELISRDYNRRLKASDPPMMGIIARDFFDGTVVTIDYPARTIRFGERGLDAKAANVVKFGPSYAIPVCFGATCVDGKVDTGSNRGLVLPKSVAEKVATAKPVSIGEGARMNSGVSMFEVALDEPVRVGRLTAEITKIIYVEPSTTDINVGGDFLKDYVLTIDNPNGLLKIERPASGERG